MPISSSKGGRRNSLFIHTGLLPLQLILRHSGTACSCTMKTSFLRSVQPYWTPLPIRTESRGIHSASVLNSSQSQSAHQNSKITVFASSPLAIKISRIYHSFYPGKHLSSILNFKHFSSCL